MGYIYKISNDVNNKVYIGLTTRSLEQRWKEHTIYNINDDSLIHRAMRKYGVEHFFIELIEECENNMLQEKEKYWIKYYNSYQCGYNMTLGGENISENFKIPFYKYSLSGMFLKEYNSITEAAKELNIDSVTNLCYCASGKIQTSYGYRWSYEKKEYLEPLNSGATILPYCSFVFYDKTNKILYGPCKLQDAVTFLEIKSISSITNVLQKTTRRVKGYIIKDIDWCLNTITFIQDSEKNSFNSSRKHSGGEKLKKGVAQIDENNNILKIYDSITEAENCLNGNYKGHISQVCKGKRKSAYGYKWKYYSSMEE